MLSATSVSHSGGLDHRHMRGGREIRLFLPALALIRLRDVQRLRDRGRQGASPAMTRRDRSRPGAAGERRPAL
jgi:hypothetical protein